ncbi:MerR family transcriptional regulator [Actinomadura chibensis]|uniref:MerR family transcriptional regulator n=1 Tax=Actinomadura chibensis TaxID=392828 RepID=A0A5D0NH07_9ACTN|nr:MerR family transcriptional regulator [Actinomadura chibensis]TYB43535.1 MerR family transcriptional regulator [Actinomadura chibensis]
MGSYSPAETAEKSGFSIDTLRYYEKIGLLSGIARNASGRRVFTDDDLSWLEMLRCLRGTGMPIAEMLRYSELARGGPGTVSERLELLQAHDRRVEEQIALLREQQTRIKWKIGIYGDALTGACSAGRGEADLTATAGAATGAAAEPATAGRG